MKTKIIKINPKKIEIYKIREAAEIIKKGGLVAFPTETVYGLGANVFDEKAVKKIFQVKKRPFNDPIIVHIAKKNDIYKLTKEVPKIVKKLIDKFWPGPLTLILKKRKIIPKIVTAGLKTVAIRMPKNKIALSLIKEAKTPIAAPSANLFGKPSPTTAQHVKEDLLNKIDLIIDGGPTKIGLESTVLDLTTKPATLLRPGGITLEKLKKILGEIKIHPTVFEKIKIKTLKSPGMIYRHYAPKANLFLIEGEEKKVKNKIENLIKKYKKKKIGVLTVNKNHLYKADLVKFVGKNFSSIAKNLFKILREFDRKNIEIIFAEGTSEKGLGLAIMNRLRKASYKIIKV
jgi:L-threonylcarbamoyladenylate synthase